MTFLAEPNFRRRHDVVNSTPLAIDRILSPRFLVALAIFSPIISSLAHSYLLMLAQTLLNARWFRHAQMALRRRVMMVFTLPTP